MERESVSSVAGRAPASIYLNERHLPSRPPVLFLRIGILASVLILEGLRSFVNVGPDRSSIARWCLASVAMFFILGYPRLRARIRVLAREVDLPPVSWRFVALHACMLATLTATSRGLANTTSGTLSSILIAVWLFEGIAAILFAGLALIPPGVWFDLLRDTGELWVWALGTGGVVWAMVPRLWEIWDQTRWNFLVDLTFWLVRQILRPFFAPIKVNVAQHLIGSDRFWVQINASCSGLEGLALALIFSVVWLGMSRREYRFPRALVVIPAAMALIFSLNAVRIAALILIGHAGAPLVAVTGFHSQAGWIAFSMVAFGITLIAPRVSWLTAGAPMPARDDTAPNPTIPYLLPLTVILGAGMISRAASAGFEWLYPLRFFAAAAAIWICRRKYPELNWKPGWLSPIAGTGVFLVWLALDRGTDAGNGTVTGLAMLSTPAKDAWIAFRCMAAVITVPIAEELAFRGFLLRRLISSDFESVDFRRFTYLAVLGSSVAFGLLHGDQWLAGSLAGICYALVMLRKGSIGDAVVAHATTNALIALSVLMLGKWHLW